MYVCMYIYIYHGRNYLEANEANASYRNWRFFQVSASVCVCVCVCVCVIRDKLDWYNKSTTICFHPVISVDDDDDDDNGYDSSRDDDTDDAGQ